MHADVSVSGADVALEGLLLRAVQHVTRRRHEDHGGEPAQRLVGESRSILGRLHGEAMCGAQRLHGGDAIGDRCVTEALGAREDQHATSRACGGQGARARRGSGARCDGSDGVEAP